MTIWSLTFELLHFWLYWIHPNMFMHTWSIYSTKVLLQYRKKVRWTDRGPQKHNASDPFDLWPLNSYTPLTQLNAFQHDYTYFIHLQHWSFIAAPKKLRWTDRQPWKHNASGTTVAVAVVIILEKFLVLQQLPSNIQTLCASHFGYQLPWVCALLLWSSEDRWLL